MDVALLYFEGCPNRRRTECDVRAVLALLGRDDATLRPIEFTTPQDADAMDFHGSPSRPLPAGASAGRPDLPHLPDRHRLARRPDPGPAGRGAEPGRLSPAVHRTHRWLFPSQPTATGLGDHIQEDLDRQGTAAGSRPRPRPWPAGSSAGTLTRWRTIAPQRCLRGVQVGSTVASLTATTQMKGCSPPVGVTWICRGVATAVNPSPIAAWSWSWV